MIFYGIEKKTHFENYITGDTYEAKQYWLYRD